MSRFRTDVEKLFLQEMVEEDNDLIMAEDATLDDIIPANTVGLFDDTSSGEDLGDITDGDYELF